LFGGTQGVLENTLNVSGRDIRKLRALRRINLDLDQSFLCDIFVP
jgi:hypothetical protein